ncbi:hypothetical protein QA597_01835 [Marinilabiliaceae bacterium ANBcel2]|nr:hypothetical protein [Marinilabiliaceae bacterium ANBcel2]
MIRIVTLALSILMLWSCSSGPSKTELQNRADSLTVIAAKRDNQINYFIETVADIEDNIRKIKEAEQIISVRADSDELMIGDGDRINDDLNLIYELMVQNREKIESLEKEMQNAGVENKRLNRLIAGLNEQLRDKSERIATLQQELKEKDLKIDTLSNELEYLSYEIDSVREAKEETEQRLKESDERYYSGWYAVGSRRELRDYGITSRDGFLFFGSTQVLQDDFEKQYFNRIDIRETDSIELYSNRGELLTSHPEESYSLIENEEGLLILNISNPELFWSISRYLVIQVR